MVSFFLAIMASFLPSLYIPPRIAILAQGLACLQLLSPSIRHAHVVEADSLGATNHQLAHCPRDGSRLSSRPPHAAA